MSKKKDSPLIFGTDPEFFASMKIDGKDFVVPPAYFRQYLGVGFAPNGTHPIFLEDADNGVKIIEDGVAFELTILPSQKWKDLYDKISYAKKLLSDSILRFFPKDCEPDVKTLPTINFDVERWTKEDEEFQQCLIFGCDTDFDAWKAGKKGKVIDARKHPYRYGGGHIHISGSQAIKDQPILAIQCLTFTTGLAYVLNSDVPELEHLRTYLYGQPGRYRPQAYGKLFNDIPNTDFGVEYRTPSNSWTGNLKQAEQVFKWTEIGIRNLLEGGLGKELIAKFAKEAQEAVVSCDQKVAGEILSYIETRI